MDRYISTTIYRARVDRQKDATVRFHVQRTAREAGFKEGWLQNAIAGDPELVIGACRAAGLTDEDWYFWASKISVETGAIDVLLLSESGRIGIVETKLSYNQEGRRKVLAQILDYAVAFPELKSEPTSRDSLRRIFAPSRRRDCAPSN